MRYNVILFVVFLFTTGSIIHAQHSPTHKPVNEKPVTLIKGLGSHQHKVSTKSAEAQKFFDQGLTLVFAFNHEEAIRSFKRATELDPTLAMAFWGMALALGPNINLDVDPEREKAAHEAVQKALALASNASPSERAYIDALTKRYSIAPSADLKKLAIDYKNAMESLVKEYPDDLDAATLYAESAMNLRPWQLWSSDGKPAEGTEVILAVLESVLRRDPNHIGAIHYYIHAVEASPNPERALAFAPKLSTAVPAAGHLVHMPAHIYMRTGDYQAAARSNAEAARADEAFFNLSGRAAMYPVMYYDHNLHFLAVAEAMSGRYMDSLAAARKLEQDVIPHIKDSPGFEGYTITPSMIMVRFRKWDDILKLQKPDSSAFGMTAAWHFARGMAYASRGKAADAEVEEKFFLASVESISPTTQYGLNNARAIMAIARNVLAARIAVAKRDYKSAIALLRETVNLEAALAYDEPPGWFIPIRESLGGVLLLSGDKAGAEQVFREDLNKNVRNGRSLFGLMESLKAQGKNEAAQSVEREFQLAWKNADTVLRVEEL